MPDNPAPKRSSVPIDIHIPASTIIKLLSAALLVYLLMRLLPIIILTIVAIFLTVTLQPAMDWLIAKKTPRSLALTLVAGSIFLGFVFILTAVFPPLIEQVRGLMANAPLSEDLLLEQLPQNEFVKKYVVEGIEKLKSIDLAPWFSRFFSYGSIAVGGLVQFGFALVLTIYLLADGNRAFRWLVSFCSSSNRSAIEQTADEVAVVLRAYMVGQALTSLICFCFTFAILLALKVPAALTLAVLAGILDILPIVGFILSIVPALLLALTVSTQTMGLVLLLYGIYAGLENYLITPRIYGNRLKLSGLVVFIAALVGGTLGGMMGAILILPVVASYPIVERIWLADVLGRSVLRRHKEIEQAG